MKGKIELYNISFLILKVELHFKTIMPEALFEEYRLDLCYF